jgi:hypothetical protein
MIDEKRMKDILRRYKCPHCGKLPPDLYDIGDDGETIINYEFSVLFRVYERLADELGYWPIITSGYRCLDHQKELVMNKISSTYWSVHVFGLALDVDFNSVSEVKRAVEILRKVDIRPRIGWKRYLDKGKTFVHFDLGFLIIPRYSPKLHEGAEW